MIVLPVRSAILHAPKHDHPRPSVCYSVPRLNLNLFLFQYIHPRMSITMCPPKYLTCHTCVPPWSFAFSCFSRPCHAHKICPSVPPSMSPCPFLCSAYVPSPQRIMLYPYMHICVPLCHSACMHVFAWIVGQIHVLMIYFSKK